MGRRMGQVDCSADSAFATCECGYRGAPHGGPGARAWAMADLERHRRAMHPEQARDADKKRRRRERSVLA